MSIVIDRQDAITALDQAVEVKGADHVQDACVYVEGLVDSRVDREIRPTVGCIVGTAVAALVGETEAIRIFAGTFEEMQPDVCDTPLRVEANDVGLRTVRQHLANNGIVLTEAAFRVWMLAQNQQDQGRPWGRVVESVKEGLYPF